MTARARSGMHCPGVSTDGRPHDFAADMLAPAWIFCGLVSVDNDLECRPSVSV